MKLTFAEVDKLSQRFHVLQANHANTKLLFEKGQEVTPSQLDCYHQAASSIVKYLDDLMKK